MALPRFSDSNGTHYGIRFRPPFYFEGMTTRVFPLRARMSTLQKFVDAYLNFVPAELARFRVFLPYAYLMLLDYGKLAQSSSNAGWLYQHEALFTVPLERYRVVDGKWVFEDWAWVSPFLYVDSETSLLLGRTLAGWPKMLAALTPTIGGWMDDPRAPTVLATLSTMVFPEMYAGARQEQRVFLEVVKSAPTSPLESPPDLRSPMAPWMAMGSVVETLSGFWRDAMTLAEGLGRTGRAAAGEEQNIGRMARRAAEMANPARPGFYSDTVNLKQFRSSSLPDECCYQALTSGRVRTVSVHGSGLLRDVGALWDPSGGYSIRLARWPSLPILETLGLEVARTWRGDGVDLAELKPVFPFWYETDSEYERFENIAWRSLDGRWRDESGRVYGTGEATSVRFNTELGAAQQTVAGPFQFTGSNLKVIPLLARRKVLQRFLDAYLNEPLNDDTPEPAGFRFDLWAPENAEEAYVYLLATSLGSVTSPSNNIGSWASQELAFLVPVRWRERVGSEMVLRGVGLVPAISFMDNHTAMISNFEVMGIPTARGDFQASFDSWMADPAREAGKPLLTVSADVLPSIGQGQKLEPRTIVEIYRGELLEDAPRDATKELSDRWAHLLRGELERKRRTAVSHAPELRDGRALALSLLAADTPWTLFTMKQFRDARDSENACYQSIVMLPRRIDRLDDLREIEEPLHVRIHEYPSLPIVSLLGLEATADAGREQGGLTYRLMPVRPFWARMSWTQEPGRGLCYRSSSDEWKRASLLSPATSAPGRGLEDRMDEGAPCDLRERARRFQAAADSISVDEARRAVETVDPQMILESILSREWEHRGKDARWARQRDRLLAARRERWTDELARLEETLKDARRRHPSPALAAASAKLRRLAHLVRTKKAPAAELDARYDALLHTMARIAQKPDHCLRRKAFGEHCDRSLPSSESWDEDWYVGPA